MDNLQSINQMSPDVIEKLSKLNQEFYSTTSEHFDSSRAYFWDGWDKLSEEYISEINNLQVVDLGCGNGRFYEFLSRHHKLKYTGIDFSPELLGYAMSRYQKPKFIVGDIIKDDWINDVGYKPNLITMFGVLHHIPGSSVRKQLFAKISKALDKNGLAVLTAWRFKKMKSFKRKVIDPTVVGIQPSELEKDDYIINWLRGVESYRYCHYTSEKEMKHLLAGLNLTIIDTFVSDGGEDRLNKYYILMKV